RLPKPSVDHRFGVLTFNDSVDLRHNADAKYGRLRANRSRFWSEQNKMRWMYIWRRASSIGPDRAPGRSAHALKNARSGGRHFLSNDCSIRFKRSSNVV